MPRFPKPSGHAPAPARASPRGWVRGLALNLALLLAAAVVVLVTAEVGTRLFSRIGPALLVADPVVGKRFVADFEGSVYVDEVGRKVSLRFNGEGFRGPDWPREKEPGTHRVAVVGDSMIAAVAMEEEETLVRQLEARLQERRPDVSVKALNFGVSSSSTGQELALYRRLVSSYGPDVVVLVLFVGNDFADNSLRLTRAPRIYFDLDESGEPHVVSVPSAPGAFTRWINLHSRFYAWQKRAFRMLRSSGRSLAVSLTPGLRVFEVSDDPDLAHAWVLVEVLLRQFQADVEVDGSDFALVVIPAAEQIHDDLWEELETRAAEEGRVLDREQPRERLSRIAGDGGIPLLDLTSTFRQAAAGRSSDQPGSPYLLGRFHLSEEGNRLAAEGVAQLLGLAGGQAVNVEFGPGEDGASEGVRP